MADRDDEAIARQEADDTAESIADLDNISDTMFVAVTFLLAALATWTTFAYGRLDGAPTLKTLYVALAVLCVAAVTGCVVSLSLSLSPRGFYGRAVGDRFLDHPWLLWRNDDPGGIEEFRARRDRVGSTDELRESYEEWLDRYDPGADVTSREAFEFSRLLNYKLVARIKAHHTAYAVALFRIATVVFALVIVLSLVVPVLL